ncbi:hypothetical protein [Paenarthrobacter sp. NPDC057981]|uniref:hypothetical protein n=1 Tax=Paenarthrobacter sp. NPDC057981 TaxID=3346297 RepID=UPI0036DE2719
MTTYDFYRHPLVKEGLTRLQNEAFGPHGFAQSMDEVVEIVVSRPSSLYLRGHMVAGSTVLDRDRGARFSREALNRWLDECRVVAYVPGRGTWTTAEVHVFPNAPGRLDLYDEEHLDRMPNGNWYPGAKPSDAATWAQQLLRFPRAVDNIPYWMWDIFRAEDVTPPIYNPQFNSVDWNNRRRPVTDRGTDLTVEPTTIDPSLEPGVFAKIGKKLFGG